MLCVVPFFALLRSAFSKRDAAFISAFGMPPKTIASIMRESTLILVKCVLPRASNDPLSFVTENSTQNRENLIFENRVL